jgi:predicted AAA+ superfamily ATPase
MFIFTGSSTPKNEVYLHDGAMRFITLTMSTLTLHELNLNEKIYKFQDFFIKDFKIKDYGCADSAQNETFILKNLEYLCKGGFPTNLEASEKECLEINKSYIRQICSTNSKNQRKNLYDFDSNGMNRIFNVFSRNLIGEKTITSLSAEADMDEKTFKRYADILENMFIIFYLEP